MFSVKADTDVALVVSSGSPLLQDRVQQIVIAGVPTVVHCESSVEHTDFVFALLSEEFGFVGALVLLGLFAFLIFSTIRVAHRSDSLFLQLACVGIVGMWTFQLLEEVGMCIGLMPITGIPLPFISFGSSSMLMQCAAVGIVQSIWRVGNKSV